MSFIFFSCSIGVLIGIVSFRYEKTFVAVVLAGLPIIFIVGIRVILPFAVMASNTPSGRPDAVLGEDTFATAVLDAVVNLPVGVTYGLGLFPVFVLAGRIGTWLHSLTVPQDLPPETYEARKQRVRSGYDIDFPS